MHASIFESALGISHPWHVKAVDFDSACKVLTIKIDFAAGTRFAVPGVEAEHPVHDTVPKRYRHLNFFQHECYLEVRVPRVRTPDGKVRQIDPPWAGKLKGFTLLFEALVMSLCREMPFAAVARLVNSSWHRVNAICKRYVELALAQADFSEVKRLAADETSRARGHEYITLIADAFERRVLFVTQGRGADTIKSFAEDFKAHGGDPLAVESISIDMSPAFIKGVLVNLPNATITFDKFHVIAHASAAVDKMRRIEQRSDPSLKGLRWKLLRDRDSLKPEAKADLDALVAQVATKRTSRAWLYKEQLREILDRKQIHVVRAMLWQWTVNVMRSKIEPMKAVARMIRSHLEGIVAWARTRQTNGFLEAINGLFQAAKRKARGYGNFETIRTVVFMLAGKLNFANVNEHAA
ncbi:ISL3 family transposase [Orrella marina]|uniref:ISL3 family transposase n=1 Tax=Orrella marina TaxID=2163011 RepID=A0A2R4XMS7_9BURK|nr:ISL3 family transposase [Orrella marina]AWB35085.1 ISL3 family transposase [Orrella marina]